jgi:hypothetical protein
MMSRAKVQILLISALMVCTHSVCAQTPAAKKTSAAPIKTLSATKAPQANTMSTEAVAVPERVRLIRNPELYNTTVDLLSQGVPAKNAAYARALVQVINQLTGQTNAGSNPVVRGALANAPKWVNNSQQSNGVSDSEGNTLVGGTQILKASLRVSFDPNPVDSLIAAAGYSYWTGERPRPILWLSLDDGRGPRLITAKQLNVIKSLADRGQQRGIRFLVPQGTPQELAALQSVINLDGKALAGFNARYQNNTMLIGKIYRSVSGWSAWWSLWQDGAELTRWPVTESDAREVIASGADNTASFFAKRDGGRLNAGRSGMVMMEIVSVDSMADYIRAMTFLQTHASIRSVEVMIATPGKLGLQVDLRSGVNAFRGLMRSSNTLQPLGSSAITAPTAMTAEDIEDAPPIVQVIERFALKN